MLNYLKICFFAQFYLLQYVNLSHKLYRKILYLIETSGKGRLFLYIFTFFLVTYIRIVIINKVSNMLNFELRRQIFRVWRLTF